MSVVTAAGTVLAARASRRTRQQERRDDFVTIKQALNEQITSLKADLSEQRAEIEAQRRRISEQATAISYLMCRVRDLVAYIRGAGMEPPAAPPMPEQARAYITDV